MNDNVERASAHDNRDAGNERMDLATRLQIGLLVISPVVAIIADMVLKLAGYSGFITLDR